jgi:8-oxo-dGTP pyrophosphatase MutT (NUDIX family)
MFNNKYCTNCGKYGHTYTCKKPIISLGILAYIPNEQDNKYLMVRRNYTYGFLDFMRGKYNIYNDRDALMMLINEMTIDEKISIMTNTFEDNWNKISTSDGYKHRDKFNSLRTGIEVQFITYTIESLVSNSSTNWEEPEWGIPKGRRNYQEQDLEAAIREWVEETGYDRDTLQIIENVLPYEEIFIGSNNKAYSHKYYIAKFIGDEQKTYNFQKCEISDCKWKSLSECITSIRPYNIEKSKAFTWIENLLSEYKIFA